MQHFFNEQTKTRIKTFVFDSAKNFHTRYKGFLIKYRQEVFLREIVKISTLGIITLIGFWFYLFFINIASTRGYFLKIAQDQLNSNRAKSDIIKLDSCSKSTSSTALYPYHHLNRSCYRNLNSKLENHLTLRRIQKRIIHWKQKRNDFFSTQLLCLNS